MADSSRPDAARLHPAPAGAARKNTGVVCSVPIGSRPANFGGELECAFLNTFSGALGICRGSARLAQGKSMLLRRSVVEKGGGIRALGAEIAEHAALTKLLRSQGLKIHLVDNPFEQPLGSRHAEVWARQTALRTRPAADDLPAGVGRRLLPVRRGTRPRFMRMSAPPGPRVYGGRFSAPGPGAEGLLARCAGWYWARPHAPRVFSPMRCCPCCGSMPGLAAALPGAAPMRPREAVEEISARKRRPPRVRHGGLGQ